MLADARRMVARGIAEELKDAPLPKATKAEADAAAVIHVETAGLVPRLDKNGQPQAQVQAGGKLRGFYNSNRVLVRPAKIKPADEEDD